MIYSFISLPFCPDADPGRAKKCGSGSGSETLVMGYLFTLHKDDDVDLEESLGDDVVMVDENEAENTSKSKVVEVQAAKAKTKEVEVKGDAALKEDEEASKTKPLKEKKVKAKKGSGGAGKERKLEVEGAEEVSMTEEWAQFHEKELEKVRMYLLI